MCFSSAKSLCPNVVAAPYAFKAYEATSRELYRILLSRTHNIQVVSCDEAVVDISAFCQANKNPDESLRASAERVAEGIRKEFFEETKCTCSVGIGIHPLSARVACGLAKPDGIHAVLTVEETSTTLSSLDLESIPTIGWSTKKALQSFMGITKCGELATAPREQLERLLGKKRAATIQDFARGLDTRTIVRFRTRASVGLCVTWGVRLKDVTGVNTMMNNIAAELCKRLKGLGVAGSALSFSVCPFHTLSSIVHMHTRSHVLFGIVVKWKVRTPGAPPPGKFLGHGKCDDYSKSIVFDKPVNTVPVIAAALIRVIGQFMDKHNVPATELRGFAVSMTRIILEKDIGFGDSATGANSTKEQSCIQAFAKLITASQIRASVHPRALPTGNEDPGSLVDLTDIPTQAEALKNVGKKVQKRITRQRLNVEPLTKTNQDAIEILGEEDEEECETPNKRKREEETEEDPDELTPKVSVDFDLLIKWFEEEEKTRTELSALDERLLQCRLTSLLTDPELDIEAATRLLRVVRLFCQYREVDTTWTEVLHRLTERANELVADTLGLPCGATLAI